MKGLIVREPWATLIVEGKKRWEVRRTNTRHRGPIAIVNRGRILGVASIVDVIELPVKEMAALVDKHYADPLTILAYGAGRDTLFAWVLRDAKKLPEPISISIPSGAQMWVKIPKEVEAKIWKLLER